jgi:hypothetical protein
LIENLTVTLRLGSGSDAFERSPSAFYKTRRRHEVRPSELNPGLIAIGAVFL